MVSFENLSYLWGVLVVIPLTLIFIAALRRKHRIAQKIGDVRLVKKLTAGYSAANFRLKFRIVIIALIIGVIAVANLRKNATTSGQKRSGIDIVVALDVSKSMLSTDIKPTRLDKAKQIVTALAQQLGDNRLGLVLFAGQAVLQMPLTDDPGAIQMYLSNAGPDAVPLQGTAIGDALTIANNAFNTQEKKYKAVILISDGEDHDPKSEGSIKTLKENGAIVYTVGVGTPDGSPIIEPGTNEPKRDANGQVVISKLNESELKDIAQKTGGAYARLGNDLSAARDIANDIDKMDKKLIQSGQMPGEQNFTSFYPFFVVLMLLLLIGEIFIPETKRD